LTLDGNCWKIETNEGFKPNNWRFTEPKWHKSFSKCSEAHAGSKLSWPKTCFVNIYMCVYINIYMLMCKNKHYKHYIHIHTLHYITLTLTITFTVTFTLHYIH
jgi:hypothetical protein